MWTRNRLIWYLLYNVIVCISGELRWSFYSVVRIYQIVYMYLLLFVKCYLLYENCSYSCQVRVNLPVCFVTRWFPQEYYPQISYINVCLWTRNRSIWYLVYIVIAWIYVVNFDGHYNAKSRFTRMFTCIYYYLWNVICFNENCSYCCQVRVNLPVCFVTCLYLYFFTYLGIVVQHL